MDVMYLLLVVAIIVAIITMGTRRRSTKIHKPYQCLTARMEWESSTPADDRIKRILAERAARLENQKPVTICDEAEKFYPTEIFCGTRFHRDR